MSGAVHLFVAVALAAAPVAPDPSACPADDLRCMGTAYVASARLAKSGEERAQYLYSAHRAFLRLFDRSQEGSDLCQAHELIRQARRGPAGELGERLAASERETLSRLRSSGVECGAGRSKRKARPLAAATPPGPPSDPANAASSGQAPDAPDASGSPELAPVPTATVARRPVSPQPEPALTAPVTPRQLAAGPQVEHRGPVLLESAPLPAKPLLIGGGVALGVSLVLGGLTVYYGTTGLAIRRRCIDEPCTTIESFDDSTRYNSERSDYEKYTGRAYLAGITGGAALVTAVALLTVGARRRAKNLALGPMLRPNAGGVLFTGRF